MPIDALRPSSSTLLNRIASSAPGASPAARVSRVRGGAAGKASRSRGSAAPGAGAESPAAVIADSLSELVQMRSHLLGDAEPEAAAPEPEPQAQVDLYA